MDIARLNPRQFQQFRQFIYEQSGIQIDERKVTMLSNRIRSRLRAGPFEDFDAYYGFLTSREGKQELNGFLDAITTNETSFLRTPKQFVWFADEYLPNLLEAQRSGARSPTLKVWSAGCANGAEPYSIALCILENQYRFGGWDLDILGTDISQQMLAQAREGVFSPRTVAALTDIQKRKFLRDVGEERWAVRDNLKKLVRFEQHNLMQPLPESGFDCIFIRNVLIYFDSQSKQTVVDNLLAALSEGGYLIVGPSEGIQDKLKHLHRLSPLIYRKEAAPRGKLEKFPDRRPPPLKSPRGDGQL